MLTVAYYDLYIGSAEVIKGQNMSYYFENMYNVDSISFDMNDSLFFNIFGQFV